MGVAAFNFQLEIALLYKRLARASGIPVRQPGRGADTMKARPSSWRIPRRRRLANLRRHPGPPGGAIA